MITACWNSSRQAQHQDFLGEKDQDLKLVFNSRLTLPRPQAITIEIKQVNKYTILQKILKRMQIENWWEMMGKLSAIWPIYEAFVFSSEMPFSWNWSKFKCCMAWELWEVTFLSPLLIKKEINESWKSTIRESNPDLLCDRPERLPLDHDGLMKVEGRFYLHNLLTFFA